MKRCRAAKTRNHLKQNQFSLTNQIFSFKNILVAGQHRKRRNKIISFGHTFTKRLGNPGLVSRVTLFLLEWLFGGTNYWQLSVGWLCVRAGQQKEPCVMHHPT